MHALCVICGLCLTEFLGRPTIVRRRYILLLWFFFSPSSSPPKVYHILGNLGWSWKFIHTFDRYLPWNLQGLRRSMILSEPFLSRLSLCCRHFELQ